jgi:PadR family transcriptional regulator, regulatory protein AphA
MASASTPIGSPARDDTHRSGIVKRGPAPESALPPAAYVVLGMIRLGARSGYEIKQTVELSIRYFWTISQAQIYPSLQRLEHDGLVRGHSEPRGNRPRRVFEITGKGEAALAGWLTEPTPMPFELRDVGMLKLFFADALPPAEAQTLLTTIRRRSEDRVSALRAIEPVAQQARAEGNAYPLLTLRMGIAYHQAMIDTCAGFTREQA